MPKVFITRLIPEPGIKMLQEKGYEVKIYPEDNIIPRKELLKNVSGIDALLCILTEKIDAEVMDTAGPQLKIIANYAVGFDNIDLKAAAERKIFVTNTPCSEVAEAVAEHTFALMIALARRIPEADRFSKLEKYKGWSPTLFLGTDLYKKTLGIVGLGRIGFAVAQRAVKGFQMKVLYTDPKPNPQFEKEYNGKRVDLHTLLEESDFISLHVPLLPSTYHLISTPEFACMKKTAFLINTARGPIVDEKALLRALETKRIAGAALDVFECEPAIDCDIRDKLELKKYDNVILTPHIASATIEARQAMSRTAAENIIAVLEGKMPPNLVN
jgi:glyoxylate reductase